MNAEAVASSGDCSFKQPRMEASHQQQQTVEDSFSRRRRKIEPEPAQQQPAECSFSGSFSRRRLKIDPRVDSIVPILMKGSWGSSVSIARTRWGNVRLGRSNRKGCAVAVRGTTFDLSFKGDSSFLRARADTSQATIGPLPSQRTVLSTEPLPGGSFKRPVVFHPSVLNAKLIVGTGDGSFKRPVVFHPSVLNAEPIVGSGDSSFKRPLVLRPSVLNVELIVGSGDGSFEQPAVLRPSVLGQVLNAEAFTSSRDGSFKQPRADTASRATESSFSRRRKKVQPEPEQSEGEGQAVEAGVSAGRRRPRVQCPMKVN